MLYEDILDNALGELNLIVQSLRWAEVAVLTTSSIHKRSAYLVTSSSYVLIAAAIENFIRDTVSGLGKEIRASGAPMRDIKTSLLSIFGDHHLSSLRDLRDYQKSWIKKIELLAMTNSSDPLGEPPTDLPLDGKTIRPIHLETIWSVFELPTSPFPNLICRATLTDIADGRNEIAHGHTPIGTFAKKKGAADTLKKITRIEELLTHITLQSIIYMDTKSYLKNNLN